MPTCTIPIKVKRFILEALATLVSSNIVSCTFLSQVYCHIISKLFSLFLKFFIYFYWTIWKCLFKKFNSWMANEGNRLGATAFTTTTVSI